MHRPMRVGGQFYPDTPDEARYLIEQFIHNSAHCDKTTSNGAILPHAGWMFSGQTAVRTLLSIKDLKKYRTAVILGAVHTYGVDKPVLYPDGDWETPFGNCEVDVDLIKKNSLHHIGNSNYKAHFQEHSIEVIVSLLMYFNPKIKIIPISIPSHTDCDVMNLTSILRPLYNESCLFIASSDLTHYGYNYGDISHGTGDAALSWVKKEKDPAFLKLIFEKRFSEIVAFAHENGSACGAGGIAVLSSLLNDLTPELIDYTTSYDMYPRGGASSFVSYAGIIFRSG